MVTIRAALVFNATTMVNVESLQPHRRSQLQSDHGQRHGCVGPDADRSTAALLGAGDTLTFDGSADTTGGNFVINSGAGNDVLTGGNGNDVFRVGTGERHRPWRRRR